MAQISPTSSKTTTLFLGPFVGAITDSSVKIWLNIQEAATEDTNIYVTLERMKQGPINETQRAEKEQKKEPLIVEVKNPEAVKEGVIPCLKSDLGTGVVTIRDLKANAQYSYQLWQDEAHTIKLNLNPSLNDSDHAVSSKLGLQPEDLFFWTLPEDGYGQQLDFLLMSCHFPETKKDDGFDGFAVWHQIPKITRTEPNANQNRNVNVNPNANVRFAILAGDQIYADEVETKVLAEKDPEKRRQHYLNVYKKFWDNEHYRRVLCSLPAVVMWDDHDITDGWGSREDSFKSKTSSEFTDDWKALFETAKGMFRIMQAYRNPEPLSANNATGFDTCFKVGKAGFVVADLRTNRNVRGGATIKEGVIWLPQQLQAIRKWVEANRKDLHTLFFVSTVVFSHGAPSVDQWVLRSWFWVIDAMNLLRHFPSLRKQVQWFNDKVGDLRDDINDAWGSDANRIEADRALDFLFELENPQNGENPLNVVILSGDIHTPGYSTIYSANSLHHEKAIIPHIVASPVSYEPFSWVGEAVFRHLTKVVQLGKKGSYSSQVSHHFCYRNVVVVSLRNYQDDESHLKVKYYLEGFPEPQVVLFDLNHGAHRENIRWQAVEKPTRWRRLVAWLTRKPIPISFVVEPQPSDATAAPLPEKPVD